MTKNLYVFIVLLSVLPGASPGWADTSFGNFSGGQNHCYSFVDGGTSGTYLDEAVTIGGFWNKVAMFKFPAKKDDQAVITITRLTPNRRISWGFVGINNNLYMLENFLTGPDTVFAREIRLQKNNHVFVHLFGEPDASLRLQVLPPLPTITAFTVTPAFVTAGQTATLNWSTLQAETVTIEPGIGGTTPSGLLEVAPDVTTTYTLTAGNSYGSASASVRLEVVYPPAITIIEPDGQGDTVDESLAVIWTDEDADSNAEISFYYDTDNTGADGTLIISGLPEDPDGPGDRYLWDASSLAEGEYWVYAVIDDGRNAPVTVYSSGPVTVAPAAPPVAAMSAAPENITSGGSATLFWTTTNADTCFIEPDVGPVEATGSVVVTPAATTVYTITASGRGGTATACATVQVDNPLTITIISPLENAFISRPDMLVMGTIENAAGRATGVRVNDMTAVVYGNRFVANQVGLEDGANTITVTAEDSAGSQLTVTRQVEADTTGHHLDITASLASGLSSFSSNLYLNGSFPLESSSINYTGPDTIVLTQEETDEYRAAITGEGIYVLTAEAEHDGITYTDQIALTGLNRDTVDSEIRAVWDSMKTRLINNNIEGAIDLFHPVVREHQRQVFTLLADDLPGIVSAMRDIHLVAVENNRAEYRLSRERIIQGQSFDVTFFIVFARTGQGWKIVNF